MPDLMDLALALPWLAIMLAMPLLLRRRVRLSNVPPIAADDAPLVSVIVPARNEAPNIGACVSTLLNSLYPRCEVIVVDDNSTDGTGEIIRILADHSDGRLALIEGAPLPDGWLGKSWACWQGAQRARGTLLLFTDADTRHDDMLLGRAVGAIVRQEVDLVSVLPRQLMLTFWERLVLPHFFATLLARYHDLPGMNRSTRPHDVVANGQFILIRRTAYDAIGGHEALRGDVVEDQRLAQRVVAGGGRMFMAHAHDMMETRMYRSLGGIIEGWSKNVALGSRAAVPGWLRPIMPWPILAVAVLLWIVPPAILLVSLFTGHLTGLAGWSLAATAFSTLMWAYVYPWMGAGALYALGYPAGALVMAGILLRSGLRGRRVSWKGRDYVVQDGASQRSP
ncbi:MAG TPA: glycosyltransferase family 2 protein [Longimicrobiales bacterium]|nr:glycosyltransferase family 2 protein [Longimicrobiales bacterium]